MTESSLFFLIEKHLINIFSCFYVFLCICLCAVKIKGVHYIFVMAQWRSLNQIRNWGFGQIWDGSDVWHRLTA